MALAGETATLDASSWLWWGDDLKWFKSLALQSTYTILMPTIVYTRLLKKKVQ